MTNCLCGQVITALGRTWHPEHFTCAHCNQELGTRNFFERDGRPYCEPDYHNLFSPRCAYCNGPILDVSFAPPDSELSSNYIVLRCFFRFRNAWRRWKRPGIQSTSSVLNVVNSSVRTVSMKGMESRTAAMTTSICSLLNAAAAASPSWRTISQHWTHSGTQIASYARSVSVYSQVLFSDCSAACLFTSCVSICQVKYINLYPKYPKIKRFLNILDDECLILWLLYTGLWKTRQRQIFLCHGREAGMPKMRRSRWGWIRDDVINAPLSIWMPSPIFFYSYARRYGIKRNEP